MGLKHDKYQPLTKYLIVILLTANFSFWVFGNA